MKKCDEKGTGGPSREKKGGSGNDDDESRKKDRQAFQEWLRERRSVRFEDD